MSPAKQHGKSIISHMVTYLSKQSKAKGLDSASSYSSIIFFEDDDDDDRWRRWHNDEDNNNNNNNQNCLSQCITMMMPSIAFFLVLQKSISWEMLGRASRLTGFQQTPRCSKQRKPSHHLQFGNQFLWSIKDGHTNFVRKSCHRLNQELVHTWEKGRMLPILCPWKSAIQWN